MPAHRLAAAGDGMVVCSQFAEGGYGTFLLNTDGEQVFRKRWSEKRGTNAAAAEMKEKIRKRLRKEEKKPAVRRALEQIDCMEISTIHSFCQRLIRQEFQTVQMDPLFQICDSSMRKKLFEESDYEIII